jgi:hypothetical protein
MERKSRAVVVGKVVPELVGIPKSSGVARGAGGGMNVGRSQGMDERDVGKNVARPGAQVAVKVPACLGAVGVRGTSREYRPSWLEEKPRRPREFAQNFRRLVMAAKGDGWKQE